MSLLYGKTKILEFWKSIPLDDHEIGEKVDRTSELLSSKGVIIHWILGKWSISTLHISTDIFQSWKYNFKGKNNRDQ